ncbi:hypothetical protein, partial [Thiolapillus sp.]|uniref:hypothetical protein n=1 Tax=Thiolapillus sp. TaxID=2017437 RepID=UPI003AF6F230
RSEAYFVFPLAQGTPGKQCGLAATGVYQPSLRSPWLAAGVVVLVRLHPLSREAIPVSGVLFRGQSPGENRFLWLILDHDQPNFNSQPCPI